MTQPMLLPPKKRSFFSPVLVELTIVILFFALSASVIVRLIAAADTTARTSEYESRAILAMLPAPHRRLTLVAAGELPPHSLLDGLALDRLVLVPDNWLAGLPPHQPRLRARHAARLAALHLDEPINTVTVFDDDDLPF